MVIHRNKEGVSIIYASDTEIFRDMLDQGTQGGKSLQFAHSLQKEFGLLLTSVYKTCVVLEPRRSVRHGMESMKFYS
jgi:hypothetical protein